MASVCREDQLQHLAPKTTAVLLSHVHCGTCC